MTSKQAMERVITAVDELSDDLVDLTRQMVRVPTETHPPSGDEGPGQDHLTAYVSERFGWEVDRFLPSDVPGIEGHPGWWPGLDYANRPNVVVRRRGAGGGRSIILKGHIDVVSAGPHELWQHHPYGGELDQGRVYGRGAVDMKGGIAAMIYAMRAVEHAGIPLQGDVIIESVVNEELGGYNGTLACCARGYEADAAIVTEATMCQVNPAHKGGAALRLRVPGKSAHSNFWWTGVSALDKALILKQALAGFQAERNRETRNNPYFSDPERFPLAAMADTVWSLSAGDPAIMSPPEEAVLDFWVDALPGEQVSTIVDRLADALRRAADHDPFLSVHPPVLDRQALMRAFEPTAVPLDHPIVTSLARSYEEVVGEEPGIFGFASCCDAMMFNLFSSTPAVIFGPGNLAVAHAPDEYVEVSELIRAARILACTLLDWCGIA